MPKAAISSLIWSEKTGQYEWRARGDKAHPLHSEEAQQGIQLGEDSSFAFQGKKGRLTLRKETRTRGGSYWYAYRNLGRKTLKKYIGRADDLTIARLEEIAAAFNARGHSSPPASAPLARRFVAGTSDEPAQENSYAGNRPFWRSQVDGGSQAQQAGKGPPWRSQANCGPFSAAPSPSGYFTAPASPAVAGTSPTLSLPPLLVPKLRLPRLHASLVPRESLLARLDAGLERKLTLLSAPAGFGKTTLVSQWASRYNLSQPQPGVAWVALDEGDNDPVRFWTYVIRACQGIGVPQQPPIGQYALALLHATQRSPLAPLPLEAALTLLLNDLSLLPQRAVLVLEDYHVIVSDEIHQTMAFVLEHLPSIFHLIMLTRVDPPFSLTRLRAYDELNELHAADLRFSQAETQTFLQQMLPFSLTPEVIAQLEQTVEGWVTGLRLLTFTLQGRVGKQEVERFLADFSGNARHILAYFVTEVLEAQTESLQLFLLRTSVLNRLTGSLCDAVVEGNGSEALLEALEHANLFLQSLDAVVLDLPSSLQSAARPWYRYHPLFAEAMRVEAMRRLGDESLRAGYARASFWYEQHGMSADAVETALAARSFERAADLMEQIGDPQHFYEAPQEHHTQRRWLQSLPEAVLAQHPRLCLSLATTLLPFASAQGWSREAVAQVERPLSLAEQTFEARQDHSGLSEVLAIRAVLIRMQGNLALASQLFKQAFVWLPESAKQWRATGLIFAGEEEWLAGHPRSARLLYQEAYTLLAAIGNLYAMRAVLLKLADICVMQGELRQGAEFYREVLTRAGDDYSDRAGALCGLAGLSYEWNDLVAAEQQAQEALDLARRPSDEAYQVQASLILARVQHAHGEREAAIRALYGLQVRLSATNAQLHAAAGNVGRQGGAEGTKEEPKAGLMGEVLLWQARLQLLAGDLAAVERWAATLNTQRDNVSALQREQEAFMHARLLLAQGKANEVVALLQPWQLDANQQGRSSHEFTCKILIAIAYFLTEGDQVREERQHTASLSGPVQQRESQAVSLLREVLVRAHREGYLRLFLDEGDMLTSPAVAGTGLLRAVLPGMRKDLPAAYMRALLPLPEARPGQVADGEPLVLPSLIEPLSQQEERVLRLLADGLTNPEIAETLIVSINTVKTQVQSIYRKLNVSSRREVREIVRSLRAL